MNFTGATRDQAEPCVIYVCIYSYILKRLPPLPPTSGTRGLDAWMLGCLSFCLPGARLKRILIAFWRPLVTRGPFGWSVQASGSIWGRLGQPGCPNELFGTPVRAGAPIWGDLLDSGARTLAACGGLGRRGPEPWQPVAACGARVDPL